MACLQVCNRLIRPRPRVLPASNFGGMNQRVHDHHGARQRARPVLADEPGTALDVTVQKQTLAPHAPPDDQNPAAVR